MSWIASSSSRVRSRLLAFALSVTFLTTGVAAINNYDIGTTFAASLSAK